MNFDSSTSKDVFLDAFKKKENAIQEGSYHGRIRRRNAAVWRTALWIACSTVLIFLVVKCTIQLNSSRRGSARMLADSDDEQEKAEQHQLLRADSEEEEGACKPIEITSGNKPSLWSRLWGSKGSDSQQKKAAEEDEAQEGPSSKPSPTHISVDATNAASNQPPPPTGKSSTTGIPTTRSVQSYSLQYGHALGFYAYPRLGAAYLQLERLLKHVESIAESLCFLHESPFRGVLSADFRLKNDRVIQVVISIEELPFESEGLFSDMRNLISAAWNLQDHRTFVLDVARLLEGLFVKVLAEAEEAGKEPGDFETTKYSAEISKPANSASRGSILFEVFAKKTADLGFKESDWLD